MNRLFNSYYLSYIRIFTVGLIILLCVPASAYYSNDPMGEIFVEKPFGDMSNCGPLSAMMLNSYAKGKPQNNLIQESIDKARMLVQKQQKKDINYRWWSFRDIKKYLNHQKVDYTEIDTKDFRYAQSRSSKIVDAVLKGNAVVVNIDMNDLPSHSDVGKFYGTTSIFGKWGHFLVIVGYAKIYGQLAYEIHDSYSEKGKNRFFFAKDINKAISKYNKKLLLVNKNQRQQKIDIFENHFQ